MCPSLFVRLSVNTITQQVMDESLCSLGRQSFGNRSFSFGAVSVVVTLCSGTYC